MLLSIFPKVEDTKIAELLTLVNFVTKWFILIFTHILTENYVFIF